MKLTRRNDELSIRLTNTEVRWLCVILNRYNEGKGTMAFDKPNGFPLELLEALDKRLSIKVPSK